MRPRAWAMAQRRHVARLWHREKGLTAEQRACPRRAAPPPDQQRKVLLLTHLAGLYRDSIGRELGETPTRVEHQLAGRHAGLLPPRPVRRRTACSPRSSRWRRSSRRPPSPARRRSTAAAGDAGACTPWPGWSPSLLLTLAGGLFVVRGGVDRASRCAAGRRGEARDRGDAAHPRAGPARSRPGRAWQLIGTCDNTGGHRHQLGVPGRPVRRPARPWDVRPHLRRPG